VSCSFQEKECLFAEIAIFENRIYRPGTSFLLGLEKCLTVMEVTVEYNHTHCLKIMEDLMHPRL
jgi:hypothetical protein